MGEQLMHKKEAHTLYFEVAPDVWGTKDIFVNMYVVRDPESGNWVLIDTGLKSSAPKIKKMAAELFGADSKPSAILLTHGHFDHVGSLKKLADEWGVRIYCHYLELPYLSGKSHYPPADGTVGGLMSKAATIYPKSPINVEGNLHILPPDGSVPFLPGWKYLHTPGHAPGHVSYFREKDRVLISGDAIVTTRQESALSVLLQQKKLSGPPKYFTYDWEVARNSVSKLAELRPTIIASGHGPVISGADVLETLDHLVSNFDKLSRPSKGRYVGHPAVADAGGFKYIPPRKVDVVSLLITTGIVAGVTGLAWYLLKRNRTTKE